MHILASVQGYLKGSGERLTLVVSTLGGGKEKDGGDEENLFTHNV